MSQIYLITSPLCKHLYHRLYQQLSADLSQSIAISQCFFYSEAVAIGELLEYPQDFSAFIALADDYNIPLNICSAAFQKRQYQLSPLAEQDFTFKGLGQFVAESRQAHHIHTF